MAVSREAISQSKGKFKAMMGYIFGAIIGFGGMIFLDMVENAETIILSAIWVWIALGVSYYKFISKRKITLWESLMNTFSMGETYPDDVVKYGGKEWKRHSIPQRVKDQIWRRDGGKCVQCGSNQKLEFDHIIPHSIGGANTYRNIQLLCEPCNRSKSAKIG